MPEILLYARRIVATLTAGPGVTIDAIVGSQGAHGASAQVTLGDLAQGESRDVFVRLTVTPRKAGVPIELLDTQIAFDDGLEDAGRLERAIDYFQ